MFPNQGLALPDQHHCLLHPDYQLVPVNKTLFEQKTLKKIAFGYVEKQTFVKWLGSFFFTKAIVKINPAIADVLVMPIRKRASVEKKVIFV